MSDANRENSVDDTPTCGTRERNTRGERLDLMQSDYGRRNHGAFRGIEAKRVQPRGKQLRGLPEPFGYGELAESTIAVTTPRSHDEVGFAPGALVGAFAWSGDDQECVHYHSA